MGTLSYGYDVDGRRNNVSGTLAATGIPLGQSLTYRDDDSLATVNGVSVSEDNSGNVLYSTTLGSFTWDERGHLQQSITTASGQTITQTNSYDALGRRDAITQTIGSSTTPISYVWDGLNVALGYNGSSAIGSLLGLDLDELYLLNINGSQSSVLKDPLGSVVGLTSSTQSLTDLYSYEPYGATTHTVGTSVNGSLFAGQADDFNTLYFMRARYYLPSIARFISRDPSGGGVNPYVYAGDNPTNSVDPTGLDGEYQDEGPGNVCSGCIDFGGGGNPGIPNLKGIKAYENNSANAAQDVSNQFNTPWFGIPPTGIGGPPSGKVISNGPRIANPAGPPQSPTGLAGSTSGNPSCRGYWIPLETQPNRLRPED